MSIVGAWGVLIIVLAVPLLLRRIPPNGLYGLRLRATLADERVWYDVNAKFGRDMVLLGLLAIVLGLGVSGLPPLSEEVQATVISAGAVLMVGVGWVRADRLSRERTNERGGPHGE